MITVRKKVDIRSMSYVKYVRREKNFIQTSHRHANYAHELIYADYGEMTVILENKMMKLRAGDCILIHGGVNHTYQGNHKIPFCYLNAMFRGKVEDSIFNRVVPVDAAMRNCLEHVEAEYTKNFFLKEEMLMSYFTQLILLMFRSLQSTEEKQDMITASLTERLPFLPSGTTRRYSEITQKAVEIIHENYKNNIDMTRLAAALRISKSHLRMLIRRETGKNFTALLQETRIAAAKLYLQESTLSLDEIAAALGYETPSFFFRIFKRMTGMTPRQYAALLQENNFQEPKEIQ